MNILLFSTENLCFEPNFILIFGGKSHFHKSPSFTVWIKKVNYTNLHILFPEKNPD